MQTKLVGKTRSVEVVKVDVVALNAIPLAWDAAWVDLARHASEPNPFLENWFFRPAVQHLVGTARAKMIAIWQHDELIGLLPVTTSVRYGRLPVQHVQNWLHYHCFYGAPLIRADCEALFWRHVLDTLDKAPWAPNFLHLVGLDPESASFQSLCGVRQTDVVHRSKRAMLKTMLDPQSYLATNLRPKKRKECRRLRSRLEASGVVEFSVFPEGALLAPWTKDFLALEESGWKGRAGSALASCASTANFFEDIIVGAHAASKLDMMKLTLDDKPLAMLINFRTAPGSFAFKIAFDETYARFSPGVLMKLESMKMLYHPDIAWTDSCAVEDNAMINSLWAERRQIVRVTVPLAGARRRFVFRSVRMVETFAARVRSLT